MSDAVAKISSFSNRSSPEHIVLAKFPAPVSVCIYMVQPASAVTRSMEVSSTNPVPVPYNTSADYDTDSATLND